MRVWNELLNKFISAFELLGVRTYVKLFWKSEEEKIKLGEYVRVRKRLCVRDSSKAKRGRKQGADQRGGAHIRAALSDTWCVSLNTGA